jgi:hypothetical protein
MRRQKRMGNPVKDCYEGGICPDCMEDIPDNVVDGEGCTNCGHVFCLPAPTEDCYDLDPCDGCPIHDCEGCPDNQY